MGGIRQIAVSHHQPRLSEKTGSLVPCHATPHRRLETSRSLGSPELEKSAIVALIWFLNDRLLAALDTPMVMVRSPVW